MDTGNKYRSIRRRDTQRKLDKGRLKERNLNRVRVREKKGKGSGKRKAGIDECACNETRDK